MSFYAVAHGYNPGVYESWDEAKKNIDGFPQPVHKKFSSKEEAEEYLKERRPQAVQKQFPCADEFTHFYAVARGHSVGVFGSYDEVKKSIADYPQPIHKKFDSVTDAVAYYEKFFFGKEIEKIDANKEKPKKEKIVKNTGDTAQSFYAVARGHKTGVFLSWDECKKQTTDFKGAKFKKFDNKGDAELFASGKTLKQIEESRKRHDSGSSDDTSPPKKKGKK